MTQTPLGQKTFLYRLYDAADALLYVGITWNVRQRMNAHAKAQPWSAEVADREIVEFSNRPCGVLKVDHQP